LIMGLTFKENCPDLRNTRVIDIVRELQNYNANVHVYDPWADKAEARHEYGLELIDAPKPGSYDAIILCVGHDAFRELGADAIRTFGKSNHVLFDVKNILPKEAVDARL
jgi:UDP-N-acetyl-D-galactosamine dehydrogenase